jgi:hypothetical protein
MSYYFNRPISKLLQEAIRQLELSLGRKQLKSMNALKVSVVVNFDQNLYLRDWALSLVLGFTLTSSSLSDLNVGLIFCNWFKTSPIYSFHSSDPIWPYFFVQVGKEWSDHDQEFSFFQKLQFANVYSWKGTKWTVSPGFVSWKSFFVWNEFLKLCSWSAILNCTM